MSSWDTMILIWDGVFLKNLRPQLHLNLKALHNYTIQMYNMQALFHFFLILIYSAKGVSARCQI